MYSKTELTEIRKQIYPRYIGQNVISNSPNKSSGRLYKVSHKGAFGCFEDDKGEIHDFRFENLTLQLKPLSEITEEDAIEVDKFEEWNACKNGKLDEAKTMILNACLFDRGFQKIASFQYLQLKGYALPQLVILNGKPVTLSVERLVELDIIETKN